MKTKSVGRYTFVLICVLIAGDAAHLLGANMRSFIESVRRKAPVVYVGSVRGVRVLQRTKFDIKAKAFVDITAVMRTPGSNPQQATIEYSSYDDKTPILEGGPQYQLRPGVSVIVGPTAMISYCEPRMSSESEPLCCTNADCAKGQLCEPKSADSGMFTMSCH